MGRVLYLHIGCEYLQHSESFVRSNESNSQLPEACLQHCVGNQLCKLNHSPQLVSVLAGRQAGRQIGTDPWVEGTRGPRAVKQTAAQNRAQNQLLLMD